MLREDLARYVDRKRSLGFKLCRQHTLLRGFVAFAEVRGDRYIKSPVLHQALSAVQQGHALSFGPAVHRADSPDIHRVKT
jgi:hypothetical protein